MTTRVIVSNTGPDVVNVEEITHGVDGKAAGQRVKPGEFVEVYVHQSQDLRVTEEGPDSA